VEIVLLATKGKPKRIDKGIKQVYIGGKSEHSRKPEEIRNRIVKLMGDIPRIELFARERNEFFNEYEGWHVWGDEIKSDIAFAGEEAGK
jgi:N6-adenosine-specific RNA methylase IME4